MKHSVINCPFPFMLEYSLDFVHSKSWSSSVEVSGGGRQCNYTSYLVILHTRHRRLRRLLVNQVLVRTLFQSAAGSTQSSSPHSRGNAMKLVAYIVTVMVASASGTIMQTMTGESCWNDTLLINFSEAVRLLLKVTIAYS